MTSKTTKTLNWKLLVGLLTFGWVTIWVYRTSLTPIYPQISEFFNGISDLKLGNISSFYFLGYVIMQIPAGLLIDRIGQRKVLFPGFGLFGLGSLLVALAPTINLVYVGSILAGIGCGSYYGVAYSLTSICVPQENRSVATAIVTSGSAVGSGFGIMFSTIFVANIGLPWQYAMGLVIVLISIAAILFNKYITDVSGSNSTVVNEEVEVHEESLLRRLLKPKLLAVYLLYFSTCFAYYLIDTWLPNFLTTERSLSQTTTGLVTTLVFFAAIPGALIFSRIADKNRDKKVAMIFALEFIAGILLFFGIYTENQTLMIISLIAYGFFGKVAVEPIIISWLSDHIPRGNVATALGLFNFFGMASSIVAPSIAGFISDVFNTKVPAFYLAVVIVMLSTVVFYLMNRNSITTEIN